MQKHARRAIEKFCTDFMDYPRISGLDGVRLATIGADYLSFAQQMTTIRY